ncbi:MAG: hypothetical protein LBD07_06305 [Spirochaetaceae bacterium]|jgi:hypothetical protein|nr:hypothetical protein [Spirochaetaceae bacterium]
MSNLESILILTDEELSSREAALAIVAGIFGGWKVNIVNGNGFSGTDILAADICFFGCVNPHPEGFSHFEKVIRHINLTLRRCGIFSCKSQAAVDYLSVLVKDCGIKIETPTLVSTSASEIKIWANTIINNKVR